MKGRWALAQHAVLALLWLAYASSYLLRKPLALVKGDLLSDLGFSPAALGWLDVALLLPYAGVSLTLGRLGEKLGARPVLGIGLVLSGIASAPFGHASSFLAMALLLAATGACHSLAWPASSSIITSWFGPSEHNYAFGIFGTSCFVGSVLATYLAVYLHHLLGWRGVFLPCAAIPAVMGGVVFLFARSPNEYGVTVPKGSLDSPRMNKDFSITDAASYNYLSFANVIRLNTLPEVCLSIFCSKCVRYAILLWLPLFLQQALHYTPLEAGVGSSAFDIGGVLGSLLNAVLVKRVFGGNNLLGTAACSALCAASLLALLMGRSLLSTVPLVLLLLLAGLFNACTDVLLTGPVAASLGELHHAPVAISGAVNGAGSLGAVLQGPLVAHFATTGGWPAVLAWLMVLAVVAALAALRAHRLKTHASLVVAAAALA